MTTPTRTRDSKELLETLEHLLESFRDSMKESLDALRLAVARALAPATPKDARPLWEQRQALIDSGDTMTPERREELHKRTVAQPGLEERLREGDALFAQWKALLASDVSSPRTSSGLNND